jgi:hypothetical protein
VLQTGGLVLPAERGHLRAQEAGDAGNGLACGGGAVLQVGGETARQVGIRRDDPLDEPGEEVVARLVDPDVALVGHLDHLVPRDDVSGRGRRAQRGLPAFQRGRGTGHPGGDVDRRLLAGERHEVEDAAHRVQRAGDDVQLAGRQARLVQLVGQREALDHRVLGDTFPVVGGLERRQRG